MRTSCQFGLRSLGLLGVGVSLGCATDTTGPAPLDAAHLFYQLTLNHHAIAMALTAPYDTLQLSAIAQSATGAALVDTGTPTYMVLNGDINITVSPTGLLTAVAPDFQAQVVASRTIGNVTHVDTAVINVNDVSPVPIFTTISFDPEPGDSAKTNLGNIIPFIYTYALDGKGDSIPNVVIRETFYQMGIDPVSAYGASYVIPRRPSVFPIVAEATVYGVSRIDTLYESVGWPLKNYIKVIPSTPVGRVTPIGVFGPQQDTVAVGATVVWVNLLNNNQPIDVVFDNPLAVQAVDSSYFADTLFHNYGLIIPEQRGGDIAGFTQDSICDGCLFADTSGYRSVKQLVRARAFPTAGTFKYHSALYGTTGVIDVLPVYESLPKFPGTP